jgi:DNA-directed RNA polymerase subunit RPC12/RpoP
MDKEKANEQIILDFSSLKDVMAKGGLVMTTYKCPNCNGMVNIPEAGKVLMCQYCGTPIKPVDIFKKIKSLMQ